MAIIIIKLGSPVSDSVNTYVNPEDSLYCPCHCEIIFTGSGGSTQQKKISLHFHIFKILIALTAKWSRIWARPYGTIAVS